jgi:methanogenic corrinoid protein MtbC1
MVFKGIGKIVGSVADIGKNVVSKVAGMAAGFMTKVLGL